MTTLPTYEVVESAVRLAGRAPSLHNSQPWRWVFDGYQLQLFSARERMLPATDTLGRQMIISCGIALGHLRTALAAAGWRIFLARFPDPNRGDHLAAIRFTPAPIVTDAERDRAAAITQRHTDRLPLAPPNGWDEFEIVLRSTFDPADGVLDVLPEDKRPQLARASELTASLRRYDSSYQHELRWWTGHVVADTGVPAETLISPEERVGVPVGRTFPAADIGPRRPGAVDQATILVLSTGTDQHMDLLRCGEVLSTVLLECTLAGYATCPLTHLTEIPRSRAVVATLTGRKQLPQALIRVGTAPESADRPTPTPRLPLADILELTGPGAEARTLP
ncbi:Acg family FMN-binding oxidoreductase [Nocardia terpenica]|uniref:NAD(P)H nitroreductase n=1 Tax=Nocardia terpenica TaxID=455432 RepID=A0A6G9Z163_9NOCA|nr:NAD(P)H nitroreductase [Nocardia terpenica]QIS18956.1 NAD(P)H nitroreductase [Nocardia terpenica]